MKMQIIITDNVHICVLNPSREGCSFLRGNIATTSDGKFPEIFTGGNFPETFPTMFAHQYFYLLIF
jgi:hypothetical protein